MRNLNILVVDDNRDLVESLADYIELKGHNVDIALTAEDGIAAAGNKDYDAILVDVGLPNASGMNISDHMKEVSPATPILLITGYSTEHLEQVFNFKDTLPVMTKPLDLDALMAWLETAMTWPDTASDC